MTTSVKDVYDIELQAFQVCNTDGEEGLTWLEVEDCEVQNKNGIFLKVSKYQKQNAKFSHTPKFLFYIFLP